MKWRFTIVLAALLAVSVVALIRWQRASVKSMYINGLVPYNHLRGLLYIVEQDCYIFEFKSGEAMYPLLGSHATVPDLPAEVKESNIGAAFPNVRILGIIRTGDGFHIASVRQDTSRTGTSISFEIVLDNESSRQYYKLDAFWMMDHSPEKVGEAPIFMPSYAVLRAMQ
jgi:hypothetical protein